MKKLTLNKETVANLSLQEMNDVKGLTGQTCAGDTCKEYFTLYLTCGIACTADCAITIN